jgi:hypothetical protein
LTVCRSKVDRADNFKDFGGGRLLLQRLVKLMGTLVEWFLQVGTGYLCGRRFVSLRPNRITALALHWLSASTASVHVDPPAGHDDTQL